MVAGFAALQYVVQEGPRHQWFASFDITLALRGRVHARCSCSCACSLRAAVPFVDFRPLAIPSYAVAMVLALVTGVAFTGTSLIVPLYMQDVLEVRARHGGARHGAERARNDRRHRALGPARQIDPRGLDARRSSLVFCAAGTFWFAFLGDRAGFDHAVLPRFVQGFGVGLLYVPLNVLDDVARAQAARRCRVGARRAHAPDQRGARLCDHGHADRAEPHRRDDA